MPAQPTPTRRVIANQDWPLHDVATSRRIEHAAQAGLPPHTLMQRAGRAVADLALAIAPHAHRIWIACGPGNNGGDGLEAAMHLTRRGKAVTLTWLGSPADAPHDSQAAWQRSQAAGITLAEAPPAEHDLAIDALLGLGCTRAPTGAMADWLARMHAASAPVLQIDLPSGLDADCGLWHGRPTVLHAPRHTLSLLTLKPGLFTADGRDAAGEVWFNDLGATTVETPQAWLQSGQTQRRTRLHNSHKGSYGDVCVVGGASGMAGAALLAARAALHAGAGRVFVGLLDTAMTAAVTAQHPALMVRAAEALPLSEATVVCGCGGGTAVRQVLPSVLAKAARLVLDADALNAIAHDDMLRQLLMHRQARGGIGVLTPHPLEAVRLLQCTVHEVQADRLKAAQTLAERTQAVVVLKGSGSVVAAPQQVPVINATGNARLASAGTGDVLAGLVGALLAQGLTAHQAACIAVARHGRAADDWPTGLAFDALALSERIG